MISVVMPVVNCLDYTLEAVESIGRAYRLILIDNGSIDETPEWAKTLAAPHIVFRQETNLGVAASWNLGIKTALDQSPTEPVVVMNNDVVLASDTIPALVRWYERGVAVPSVLAIGELGRLETWPRREWMATPADFCCFLVGNRVIHTVGYFDEEFRVAYMEDLDYGMRVLQAGLRQGVCYDAVAYHHGSVTIKKGGVQHGPAFVRNAQYFQRKWGMPYESARRRIAESGVMK